MIIGLGVAGDLERIAESIRHAGPDIMVRCYLAPDLEPAHMPGEIIVSACPWEAMVHDLFNGTIDGAVRGNLPASQTLACLKQVAGVERLERVALLATADGTRFLLAPVGVDEGWTAREKVEFVTKARELAAAFGMDEKVAVLSGGRLGDLGRHPAVDRTLADAALVAELTGAEHAEILIEDAVGTHGVVIAPDGISGNLIFRTLTYLGHGEAHGALVVNISRIFVDTSRVSPDYSNAILLAAAVAESKKSP
jgi:putative methanogen marker protein 4